MLVVVDWLNEYLSEPLSPVQITSAMESAGIEVEETRHPPLFDDKIITTTVEEIKPHPEADKLKTAVVKAGDTKQEVVCGAPNLKKGQRVVLAQVGSKLPDGTKIQKTEIRGQTSNGMLCSERELGLGSNHDGILELGPEVKTQTPLKEVFGAGYTVIDVKHAANRWDLQSYQGIVSEIAAHSNVQALLEDASNPVERPDRVDNLFQNNVQEEVPVYGLIKLKVSKDGIQDSPAWMQQRLRLSGIKPINGVVDVTNYVMLDTGQPVHAFDVDSLNGSIEVRFAKADDTLTTLDGTERTLSSNDLVIADKSGPVALAGVIGGQSTEITQETNNVIIEAATFANNLVRKSAQRHGLRTEASARFERGIPMQAAKRALKRTTSLLIEHMSAEAVSYQSETNRWPWVQHIGLQVSKAMALSGLSGLTTDNVAEELHKLQFEGRPFDIVEEARKHLGKPYKFGAKFRTDGTEAFDCSYLIDYIYSLIDVHVGHTALGQYELGTPVSENDLRPGDVVFYEGKMDKSANDHFYTSSGNGEKEKNNLENTKNVGHNGIYVGDNKVVTAGEYRFDNGQWVKREEPGVIEVELEEFTENPGYLGARRYVDKLEDYVAITVPWWRPDVTNQEDVIEEVVKLVGLDKVQSTLPPWSPANVSVDNYWHRLNEIRWLFYGLGLFEVTTYPFVSDDDITTFKLESSHLELANPRSQEQSYLRTTLLPLLVRSIVNNTNYRDEFSMFEIARVFEPQEGELLPKEHLKLGIAAKVDNVLELKGIIDQLMEHTNINQKVEIEDSTKNTFLHPGRQARLLRDKDTVGWFGELHPDILATLKHKDMITYAEIDLSALLNNWQQAQCQPLPKYPSSYRDVTVSVAPQVRWQDLYGSLKQIENARFSFADEYYKDEQKSITIHIELQAIDATLTDKDIQNRMQKIQKVLEHNHGAQIVL